MNDLGPPARSGSCIALIRLITSLSCPHLGQPVHWLQKGQPTLLIADRSWQASSMLSTHRLCPLTCPFCSSLGHGEQGKTTRERKKGPSYAPVIWQHQPPSLERMPTRKLTQGAAWWCPLKPCTESQQAWAAASMRGGGFSADQPRGGLQGGQPPRSTPR